MLILMLLAVLASYLKTSKTYLIAQCYKDPGDPDYFLQYNCYNPVILIIIVTFSCILTIYKNKAN